LQEGTVASAAFNDLCEALRTRLAELENTPVQEAPVARV
jgi:hypothetical protein